MHTLPALPYAYDALDPVIAPRIMELHHSRHHQAYVDKLNTALADYPELAGKSAEDLIRDLAAVPEDIRGAVRNHGGGHVNHSFFWELMTPGGAVAPTGQLAAAIDATFGSFEAFQAKFNAAGAGQFGSGWVWLVADSAGELKIMATPNQDSPISQGLRPIIGNDVWEHAYYLQYENRRPDYLAAWWKVVNWDIAEQHFAG